MTNSLEARLVISADDRTGRVLDAVARKLDAVSRKAQQVDRVGRKMAASDERVLRTASQGRIVGGALNSAGSAIGGRVAAVVGTAALAAGMREAVTRHAEVERMMTRIGITADASRAEMRAVTAEAQKMAIALAMPFNKVAEGFEALAAQGKSMAQIRALMPSVAATAQASGADPGDMAKSAGALADHLRITPGQMQSAFDLLVAGGKAGQFEAKDMARYLPALAPQAAAVGMLGPDGLARLVAVAQTVRRGSGTSEEAASSLSNIFAKMESDETAKRFKKFGVDLRTEMKNARKEGKDLLEVFTQLTDKALKGDLSKIPQLFQDMEFARGMRALMSLPGYLKTVKEQLKGVDGSTMRDLNTVLEDSQARLDRLASSWDRLKTKIGEVAEMAGAGKALNWLSDTAQMGIDDAERLRDGKRTNAASNAQILWNFLNTGGAVASDQPAEDIAAARDRKVFRDLYDQRVDTLANARDQFARMNNRGGPQRFLTEQGRAQAALDVLTGLRSAHDETALQLAENQGMRNRIRNARINGQAPTGPIVPGLVSFGLRGYPTVDDPWSSGGPAPMPTSRPSDLPQALQKLEDIFAPGNVKAGIEGSITVEVQASPLLQAQIRAAVKDSTTGAAVNVSGIGSTGKSSPDVVNRGQY